MPDWTKPMQQTYEFFVVDPSTWKDVRPLDCVKSCTINRDSEAETLGSATFQLTETITESYVRVYLVTIQNGVKERHPLGTFLAQTPSSDFDGKVLNASVDAYTPLIELKEKQPPIGYFVKLDEETLTLTQAGILTADYARAPVVSITNDTSKTKGSFVADTDDTWLTFISDLLANEKYKFDLDEMGRILFKPDQELKTLQPVWTYNDDNSSILQPEITIDQDIYGIPNVVEVIYSTGTKTYYSRKTNDDKNSIISIPNRGREIVHRVTDPSLIGASSQKEVDDYAEKVLSDLSTIEATVTYTHGYCPVRLGDCVRLDYKRAKMRNIKAKVISQSIQCKPGCPVKEKAVFITKLWR